VEEGKIGTERAAELLKELRRGKSDR
jgi:hypothetical protein